MRGQLTEAVRDNSIFNRKRFHKILTVRFGKQFVFYQPEIRYFGLIFNQNVRKVKYLP